MRYFSDYSLLDIFKFEKRDITSHLLYDMKLGEKMKDSFEYLTTKLPIQKLKPDLLKLKWSEGKNYDWCVIKENNVTLIIRTYQSHFTIFFHNDNKEKSYENKYGCFSFNTDKDKLEDKDLDMYYDNPFTDLNHYIKPIISLIEKGRHHFLWNSYSLKKNNEEQRPEHIQVKTIWNGDVTNVNDFIFCCEELFGKYLELFAENDMLEKIKTFKVGELLNNKYKIKSISTKVKDGYYHDAGMSLENSTSEWNDVYSLTRWYLNDIFP